MKKTKCALALILAISTVGCGAQPDNKEQLPSESKGRTLSTTPDLSTYERVELYSQGGNTSEPPVQLLSQFAKGRAQFEVTRADGTPIGRLHVQPDDCRDEPNAECERRFTINGRIQALGASLSCVVPVRNDTSVGYGSQTLSGLCQSQYGRAYTIQMFPR